MLIGTHKPSQMNFDLQKRRLYGILDLGYVAPSETTRVATEMLEGGVEILQLRAKGYEPEQILELALPLVAICRSFGVPLIINDTLKLWSNLEPMVCISDRTISASKEPVS